MKTLIREDGGGHKGDFQSRAEASRELKDIKEGQ